MKIFSSNFFGPMFRSKIYFFEFFQLFESPTFWHLSLHTELEKEKKLSHSRLANQSSSDQSVAITIGGVQYTINPASSTERVMMSSTHNLALEKIVRKNWKSNPLSSSSAIWLPFTLSSIYKLHHHRARTYILHTEG